MVVAEEEEAQARSLVVAVEAEAEAAEQEMLAASVGKPIILVARAETPISTPLQQVIV
jgi:hypothetical protein